MGESKTVGKGSGENRTRQIGNNNRKSHIRIKHSTQHSIGTAEKKIQEKIETVETLTKTAC